MSSAFQTPRLLLGIDTCGPSGSVALGRLAGNAVELLGQIELEGKTYSATLIAAVADLLAQHTVALKDVDWLVAVDGPGSFTGVRVGLSAVKGLAEGAGIPAVAISRLEVLARKASLDAAALDAHRHEVFLRADGQELLAGAAELASLHPVPRQIAVCDEAAIKLLSAAWPDAELVRVAAPSAFDALRFSAARGRAGEFADAALLDGRYLRRSDAEIFGDTAARP